MSSIEEVTTYGPWEKDRVLGCGGFGIVTLWKNVHDSRYIALKKCRWEGFSTSSEVITKKQKERWSNEVDIMKRLSHRNVVESIPLPAEFRSMKSELPILSMEFCSLGDLRQVLNRPENCCGLQEIEVRRIISDIKNAVAYLHIEKITHRDLKPENIVLKPDKDTPGGVIYKLIDLGYAKELDQSSMCNSFVGTLQYLAPELFLNSMYTSSVDYWSLGLVSHEIITGVRPFLPNMPPAQWMMHVEKKKSDVICAYQRVEDNSIVFKKELFKENHVSDYLRAQLEKWLMVALEWNPDRRGKQNNELVIFSMIDSIFSKKIVLVFCVKSYKKLSYEVDSATAVSTLKTWIERDANQPVSQQLLLLPNGEKLHDDQFAIACWDPAIQDVMLYVLPTTSLTLPRDVPPYFPELVQFLLKNSKDSVDYAIKRRTWANAVYFIYQELHLYQCFLDAYAVKMLWLVSLDAKLAKMFQESCAKLERLKAVHHFAEESLKCDQRYFTSVVTALLKKIPQERQTFGNYEKNIVAQCMEFKEELDHQLNLDKSINLLQQRISSIKTLVTQLEMFHDPSRTKLHEMRNALKGSYRNYANLINSKKTEHLQVSGSNSSELAMKTMMKLIYNFLKVRDKALNDEDFSSHLRRVNACELEMKTVEKDLNCLLSDISASSDRIMSIQFRRQQEFWTLITLLSRNQNVNQQVHPPPPSPSPTARIIDDFPQKVNVNLMINSGEIKANANGDFSVGNPSKVQPSQLSPDSSLLYCMNNPPIINVQQPFSSNGSVEGPSSLSSLISTSEIRDASVIFFENENIRTSLMEGLTEAREMMQSIIVESRSMDWNSLYELE